MWSWKLLLVLVVWFSGPARVQATGQAEKLFKKGKTFYALAQFQESLSALAEAEKATNDSTLKVKIWVYQGLNLGELGQKLDARMAFAKALRLDPAVCPKAPFKERLVGFCLAQRRRMKGTLKVIANRVSTVLVDGQEVGQTPKTVSLPIGAHLVSVKPPDGQRQVKKTVVYAKREVSVSFQFRLPTNRKPATKKKRKRLWTWVMVGGAAATALVGSGLQISARVKYDEWQEGASRKDLTASEVVYYNGLADELHREEAASWALLGIAGALTVTAVILFFVEDGSSEKPSTAKKAAWSLTPILGKASGLSLQAHF